jgi:hypothetical protein
MDPPLWIDAVSSAASETSPRLRRGWESAISAASPDRGETKSAAFSFRRDETAKPRVASPSPVENRARSLGFVPGRFFGFGLASFRGGSAAEGAVARHLVVARVERRAGTSPAPSRDAISERSEARPERRSLARAGPVSSGNGVAETSFSVSFSDSFSDSDSESVRFSAGVSRATSASNATAASSGAYRLDADGNTRNNATGFQTSGQPSEEGLTLRASKTLGKAAPAADALA